MIQSFLIQSRAVFYTNLFTIGCQLIALFTSLFLLKKEKLAALFLIYSCAAFSLFIINEALLFPKGEGYVFSEEAGNIIFALIEYLLFFIYFQHILSSSIAKRIRKFFLILFIISVFTYFLYYILKSPSNNMITKFSDFLISSELIFLASLYLVYYFEIFNKRISVRPRTSPSFWIVTGLFFYSVLIAPFFMITEEILVINKKFYHIAFCSSFYLVWVSFSRYFKGFTYEKIIINISSQF